MLQQIIYKSSTEELPTDMYDFFVGSMKCGKVIIRPHSDGKSCELWDLEIFPNYRGKKYSHVLMQDIISTVKQMGRNRIWLGISARNFVAAHVYKKAGFNFVENPANEEVWFDCMELILPETASSLNPN